MCSVSQVELNECVQCEFTFINTGKFNFSYQAELSGPKALVQYLEFSPMEGNVDIGQSASASLNFQPFKKCVLKGLELRIKVRLIEHCPTLKALTVSCLGRIIILRVSGLLYPASSSWGVAVLEIVPYTLFMASNQVPGECQLKSS